MATIIGIVASVVSTVVAAMLVFVLQAEMKENKAKSEENERLRKEKELLEKQHNKALEDGMLCLLRESLIRSHEKYTTQGFISSKALESGLHMYDAYKALGGNGMIDQLKQEVSKLPVK